MRLWTRRILLAALPVLAILAIGCGGGGGGGSTSTSPQVTVSPVAAFVAVNGSQLFTAAVTGVPTIAIASSNGAVRAANVVTITTTAAHNLTVGQSVRIAGVTDVTFDGTFTVTAIPTPTTFTYAQSGLDATSGGGTVTNIAVKWSVNNVVGGNSTVGTITTGGLYAAPSALPPAVTATIASNGASRASNVVTITTTAAHNFLVGQVVVISGVTDTTFNGTFAIASVPSTTTFTYSQTANNATSGGGTASSFAVTITATSIANPSLSGNAVASIDSGITVTVTPSSATVGTSETFQFVANVTGSSNNAVNWFVNGVAGGNTSVGQICVVGVVPCQPISTTSAGSVDYLAPASAPTSNTVTIATTNGAVRNSSNVVTITTTAAHGFSVGQTVVIAGVSDTTFNGTFTIASVPSASTFTYAQTGSNATSGGGTASSVSSAVTIKAVSAADTTRSASAAAIIVTAADPTLTSISPTTVAQGAVFQDVYLTGTNLISTTTARVNGVPLPSSAILRASATVLRARLSANLLASAITSPTPGTLTIDLQRQNGFTTPAQTLNVVTVRPALVGASPDSGTQGGSAVPFNVNGGYFGPGASPVIQVEFAGNPRTTFVNLANDPTKEARQANVTIGPADLATAGLFPVGVRSAFKTALFAATNFAVQPSSAGIPTAPAAMLPVGTKPGAVAINTATGMAVVANHDSNDITLIALTPPAPAVCSSLTTFPGICVASVAVGNGPTGVAADDLHNTAVVANNGGNSISIIDLATRTNLPGTPITANIGSKPFSVGVNPLTGLALVAYQNSNRADILDLTQSPPAIVSTTTISTGGNPQVAVNPRLNWAVVTPGGAGALSIVDLSRRTMADVAATNGASRASGITTITTKAAHPFQQNEVVLITGILPDTTFNGIFTINSVPSSTTFTYVQSGAPNATSGGGTIVTTPPLAAAAVGGINARGIAINGFTQRAILADPASSSLVFFNLLDQVVTSLSLGEIGATAAAFNPFTNIAVTVNPNTNQASVIDPRTPAPLTTISVSPGTGPKAVAIDPGSNLAVVANETSGDVTILSLGGIRSLHLAAISLPLSRQLVPGITFTSTADLPITLLGKGFVSGSQVRLNGVALTPSSVTDRQLTVTVPAISFLAGPSRYVVDVLNPGGTQSNVLELAVVQVVDLVGAGGASCTAPAPLAVAIDPQRDLAVVTNSGCSNVSVVDLSSGTIKTNVSVGANPGGVAISPRLGLAVVSNSGAGNVSLIDLTASSPSVKSTVTVGSQPLGVAVNEATGQALVANSGSASLSIVDLSSAAVSNTITLDRIPEAVAVDPVRGVAAVADAAANNLTLVNLSSASIVGRVPMALPTAVVFDPVTTKFVTNTSLGNNLFIVNPDTLQAEGVRSSINPTSIAYNFASGTLVTVNTASGTFSVMDMIDRRIRDVLAIPGSPRFSVDIHPRTNLAVIADQANNHNRLLLFPLPQ
jgi:DNA-binding beta-propeller fold protein YncE